MQNTLIEFSNVTINRRKVSLLDSVNLTIEKGGVYGLLGHSGSGKSLAIKSLMGFERIKSGSISIRGLNISKNPRSSRKSIGYVPETLIFFDNLSAYENLAQAARLIPGVGRQEILDIMDRLNIKEVKGYKVERFNKYLRKLLGVARAMLGNPELIILDNIEKDLDLEDAYEILDIIKTLIDKDNQTIVIASSDIDVINKYCTHISIFEKGRVIVSGNIEDVLEREWELVEFHTSDDKLGISLFEMEKAYLSDDQESFRIYGKKGFSQGVISTLVGKEIRVKYAIPIKLTLDDYIAKNSLGGWDNA